jgi:hypothetical protein
MHDVSDYELQKTEPAPGLSRPNPPKVLPWIALAALVAAGVALWFYVRGEPAPAADAVSQTDVAVSDPARPLGAPVEAIDLPPLDDTDPIVREFVRALSSHPRVAAWLATNGLIRNFTVSVDNVAAGRTPSPHLRVLRPPGSFAVVEGTGGVMIDTRSYNRYNDLAAAVASIDASGAAQLYSKLKPRIEDAYRELGSTTSFDRALESAIARLLQAPAVEGDVALIARGALYQFNDPRLERLTAAEKQLVRMGPRNVRAIQRKLREIALALGIPAERLPSGPR